MEVLQWITAIFKLFDRRFRMRLWGYRPEVMCLVLDAQTRSQTLLIAPQGNSSAWMPAQEGIEVDEGIEQAAVRCLEVELGLAANHLHYRRSAWLGRRKLPKERQGERDLPYSLRKLIGKEAMIGKAYFGALVLVDADAAITANPAEVADHAWVPLGELAARLHSNSPEKLRLIQTALERFGIASQ